MNVKSLMTTSVIALISASAVQAADVIVPHEVAPAVITAPTFSWTGFYIGGQIGGFSSKIDLSDKDNDTSIYKDLSPKLSGLIGGLYAGSNFDLGSNLVLGVETDLVWSGKKDTVALEQPAKPEAGKPEAGNAGAENAGAGAENAGAVKLLAVSDPVQGTSAEKLGVEFKQNWSGATRARIGFAAADRIMPYIAGGVAYTQLAVKQGALKEEEDLSESISKSSSDETATMVGFTIGGGVDFAMTDNVLLRAEYRYSDFGKKKFFKEEKEYNFKTNDFRVGVAYKF